MPQNHNFAGFLKAFALQFLQKAVFLPQNIRVSQNENAPERREGAKCQMQLYGYSPSLGVSALPWDAL